MLHDFRREAGPRHLRIHPAQRVVAEQRRPICAGEEGQDPLQSLAKVGNGHVCAAEEAVSR